MVEKYRVLLIVPALAGMFMLGFVTRELTGVTGVLAQNKPGAGKKCSEKTLNGSYGIRFDGQKINTGPIASISRIVFDGDGTFTTSEHGTFAGAVLERAFTGPYTINDDCTGKLDFSSNITVPPHEAHGDFVIVDEGKEFYIVDIEAGWAASGVGKRQ